MNSSRYSTSSILDDSLNDDYMRRIISKTAEEEARRVVIEKAHRGLFRTKTDYENEYRNIFHEEYRRAYQHFKRIHELATIGQMSVDNQHTGMRLSMGRNTPPLYDAKHAYGKFTRRNFIVHIQDNCITVSRLMPELVERDSEMHNVFINSWPGPLFAQQTNNYQVIDYMTTIQQHVYLEPRYQILWNLLMKIIRQSGVVSGADIAELLLTPEETKIHDRDDSLSVLHKHLFLGKRRTAIKYASQARLWALAQCLAFLDKHQPSIRDRQILHHEDPMLMVNIDYVVDMETNNTDTLLSCLYKSLMNNLLMETGRSINPVAARTDEQFAMIIANECDIHEYDTTNELYKLIIALRNKDKNHIINLDLVNANIFNNTSGATIDEVSSIDNLSDRSLTSFMPQSETPNITSASTMCLNEIWEYALNLKMATASPHYFNNSYTSMQYTHQHFINLVPHKLVFASRLLDFGYIDLSARYLDVIRLTLNSTSPDMKPDIQYDWNVLRQATEILEQMIRLCQGGSLNEDELLRQQEVRAETQQVSHQQPQQSTPQSQPQQQQVPQQNQDQISQQHPQPQQVSKQYQPQQQHHSAQAQVQPQEVAKQQPLQQQMIQPLIQTQQQQAAPEQQQVPEQQQLQPQTQAHPQQVVPNQQLPPPPQMQPRPQLQLQTPLHPQLQPQPSPHTQPRPQLQSQPQVHQSQQHQHQTQQPQQQKQHKQNNNNDQQQMANSDGGLLGRIIGADFIKRFTAKNEMHLPEDDQKNIVFDKDLGRWVDKSDSGRESDGNISQGPPRGDPGVPLSDRQFHNQFQVKAKRYVNVWEQQQQKQQQPLHRNT